MSKPTSSFGTYFWRGLDNYLLQKWSIDDQIVQVSLGLYHSALLTADGHVLCCGKNSHGQLGCGDEISDSMEPALVRIGDGESICIDIEFRRQYYHD